MTDRPLSTVRSPSLFPVLRFALFLIVHCSLFTLVACSPPGANVVPTFVPPPAYGPPPGTTYTVEYGDVAEVIEARGRVAAKQEAPLMLPVGGVLKAIHVSPGDQVDKGTLLAELDAPETGTDALMAQFSLELAELQYKIAELQLERTETPYAIPDVRLAWIAVQRAEGSLEQAKDEYNWVVQRGESPEVTEVLSWTVRFKEWDYQEAQVRYSQVYQSVNKTQAINELELEIERLGVERLRLEKVLASEQLSNTLLLAPLSGVIVSIEKHPGDQIGSYEPIGVMADPSELWIVATVLEEDIDRITVGQPVAIRLDVYPTEEYTGTVLQIVSQITVWQGKSAYEVTIVFDKGQDIPATIRMGADIIVAGRSRENVLLIPSQAILTIGGREYVEVVKEDGDIERVEVQTGITNGTETEIVDGLEAGQEIRIP